jgi:hypothetical protein
VRVEAELLEALAVEVETFTHPMRGKTKKRGFDFFVVVLMSFLLIITYLLLAAMSSAISPPLQCAMTIARSPSGRRKLSW